MLINAINKAEGEEKAELLKWINAEEFDREEKVKAVTEIYNHLGIDQMAKAKMEEYYQVALNALSAVNVPEERKTPLLDFAKKMMKREK